MIVGMHEFFTEIAVRRFVDKRLFTIREDFTGGHRIGKPLLEAEKDLKVLSGT